MDKTEPWQGRPLDLPPGVSLYQMGEGNGEKHWEMSAPMLMVAAWVGREITSVVLQMWMRGPI